MFLAKSIDGVIYFQPRQRLQPRLAATAAAAYIPAFTIDSTQR